MPRYSGIRERSQCDDLQSHHNRLRQYLRGRKERGLYRRKRQFVYFIHLTVLQHCLLLSAFSASSAVRTTRSTADPVFDLHGGTGTPGVEERPYGDGGASRVSLSDPWDSPMDWGTDRLRVGAGRGICALGYTEVENV